MGNSFGHLLKIHTFGESHGVAVGTVIDGFPAGFKVDLVYIQEYLERRRPGQSDVTTSRNEPDYLEVLSGIQDGISLGSPICIIVRNKNYRENDYSQWSNLYRPSHADFTYHKKYGIRSKSGGGRASARETIGRVVAGALSAQWLREKLGVEILSWVDSIGDITANIDIKQLTKEEIEESIVRCPEMESSTQMINLIHSLKKKGDSVGGAVGCIIRNLPIGLGAPVFDKLEADLAKAMMSLPATKGFEIGSGFDSTRQNGSKHNDLFIKDSIDNLKTQTNHSGGVQGGISNGMPLYFRVGFKPPATIALPQVTYCDEGREQILEAKGRHDACVVPRAVPIVESMSALVIMDHYLRNGLYIDL